LHVLNHLKVFASIALRDSTSGLGAFLRKDSRYQLALLLRPQWTADLLVDYL